MNSPMEFWGVEVKAGVPTKVVPNDDMLLHLSQACVANAKNGSEQALISVKVGDQKLLLGALSADKQPQISFDLVFEKEFELSHTLKSGSVHFLGYQTFVHQSAATGDDEFSDSDYSSEDEELPLDLTENGVIPNAASAKPAPAKPIAAKPESSGKQKVKIEEPVKDDDSDDVDSEDDDSDDDISGESDSEMAEGDSEDNDSDEEEEETPTPKKVSKKRPNESASKTPVPAKKAKPATPLKTDGKNVHNATPHPAKKSGKTAEKTPKSGGDFSCKSCSKTFGSDGALSSHNKAKHSAEK